MIVPAQPPIRLTVHVGPHKTGSTSVQSALSANRDILAAKGVWYPPSLPGSAWPYQHADAWRLLQSNRHDEFDRWLDDCREEAIARGCDTLLLSCENFHIPKIRPALAAALARHRRLCAGETRYVFVRRDLVDLARSRALSHITGETGFYFFNRYELRTWACDFAAIQLSHQRWFARRAARFVELSDGPRQQLAARILEAASDRGFPEIVTGDVNPTASRLADAQAIMTYGLRVMHHLATRDGANAPRTVAAARLVLGKPPIDEDAFVALYDGFRAAVSREVKLGIADFESLPALVREWRIRFRKPFRAPGSNS